MPIASIVVPVFNAVDELRDTMASLFSQTYIDYEIIVVDDGSNDGTATLLREYVNDPEVRVITQRNRGPAGALNSGIAAARGKFIGFFQCRRYLAA
ncbi:glycosyltransferase family 2 protein [Sulfitobacter sp.]|uniref:glycosyltransferase family 2 protein n=1 Tax=Sulfitobacter sp. TaxID=1903071 RepID=UPI003002CB68